MPGPTLRFALLAQALCWAALPLLPPTKAMAQSPSFNLVGHIEDLTSVGPGGEGDAVLTVQGIPVELPHSLLVTLPGRYLTVGDLFRGPALGPPGARTGLALKDPVPPRVAFETEIIGNIVGGRYVAGVVRISQGALHQGAGFIQAIDPPTGEMRIGAAGGARGARVRLNDPTGIYGPANSDPARAVLPLDARFALDPDNSPVHAKTGFPVCVPRGANDARCPETNRPTGASQDRFTCAARADDPPAVGDAPIHVCNAKLPVPLRVGDYVTYFGMLQPDPAGGLVIAAHGLQAELGIYTVPRQDPAYVTVEVAIQGTKGATFEPIRQEETTRFRVVGFTTDPARPVEIALTDSDRAGHETVFTGNGGALPANGPLLGRFKKTWPAKDDARAVRRDVVARIVGATHDKLLTGTAGQYTAPVGEYLYPELLDFGVPPFPLPVPFENFCFLQRGGGTFQAVASNVAIDRLNPFPASGHPDPQPVGTGSTNACDGQ